MTTRHGIEDYVSDCVIRLDHRTNEQMSTRRLQVKKYRGSRHGTNEFPFVISRQGFEILPITSLGLTYPVCDERISTGIPRLDTMLSGGGYFRGSSLLISGTAGTGKTSMATQFVQAACSRGERALFISFEESPAQLRRNLLTIGQDLAAFEKQGLLLLHGQRPTNSGIDAILLDIHSLIDKHKPSLVVVDPITNIIRGGDFLAAHSMLTHLLDDLKHLGVTSIFTDLAKIGDSLEGTNIEISSLIDTWISLSTIESNGERNRLLYIIKSRGMAHSNQIREYLISDKGIDLAEVYLGPAGVLTGSERYKQESKDQLRNQTRQQETKNLRESLDRQQQLAEARIAVIQAELAEKRAALNLALSTEETLDETLVDDRQAMRFRRQADEDSTSSQAFPHTDK